MTQAGSRLIGRIILAVPVIGLYYVSLIAGVAYSPGAAASLALWVTAQILALGFVVWWLVNRWPWPAQPRIRDYLRILLWGTAYTLTGHAVLMGFRGLQSPDGVIAVLVSSVSQPWFFQNIYQGVVLFAVTLSMVDGIQSRRRARSMEDRALAMARLATTARLAALQSQLTPHFFANALHAIGDLVHRDPAAAEEAIERLGAMLRYTNEVVDRETVPLHEEFAFAEDTIALHQLRLGGRLEVTVGLPDALRQAPVPPFSVQPVVENALRHGLIPRTDGGRLQVVAERNGSQLLLRVSDDGEGFPEPSTTRHGGLGLRTLRERLVHHHPEAGLRIDSRPGDGATVTIVLPLVEAPDEGDDG